MPVFSVADQVNDDIILKPTPVLGSYLTHLYHVLHIVRIDVEDGSPRRLGQLRTMKTRPCFDGCGREADLVVSDEMYGSTHSVIMEVTHLHGFIDYTLPGEGSITMNSNAKGLAPRLVVHVVLLSTHSTSDDGVDEFQVRGVGQQVDADFLAAGVDLLSEGAQVVLHISRITPLLLIRLCTLALELIKDIL